MQQQDHILNYFNTSNMIILLPMVMIAHFIADNSNDYDDSDVRWIASESCVPGRYSVGFDVGQMDAMVHDLQSAWGEDALGKKY